MCLNKQDYEYALRPKYTKTLLGQCSEYGRVIKMRALHGVLNMPESALTEFLIYLSF